jgi:hypothetical protein
MSKKQASDTIDAIFYSLTITYEMRQVVTQALCSAYWIVIVS